MKNKTFEPLYKEYYTAFKKKIIVVAHQKGGVGKSTIAQNIAVMLKAIVIDLDVQETITEINEFRIAEGLNGLKIIKFDSHQKLQNYLENYNQEFPLVIDCGGFDSSFNNIAMCLADIVITPVSEERIEILGLKKFQKIIENNSKILGRKINCHVLLNKIHHKAKNFTEMKNFIDKTGVFKLLKTKITRRNEVADSVPAGYSVCEYQPDSKSVEEFYNLLKEISIILKSI